MWNRELPHDVRRALFGGSGEVRVWNLVAAPRAPFAAVLACELDPGGRVGAHVQERYAEVVIVIEGEARVTVNGQASPVGPGGVIELPLGAILAIDNGSNEQLLRYLIIKAAG
jgi:quercetin dioxygenase-like cupin family protein